MASVCDVCGKGPGFGNNVSHSHVRTRRRWNPNIQTVHAMVGRRFRHRPAIEIVDEIEHYVRDHGIRRFAIEDDNFTFSVPRVEEICHEVLRRDDAAGKSQKARKNRIFVLRSMGTLPCSLMMGPNALDGTNDGPA